MKLLFLGTGAADSIGIAEKNNFQDKNYRRCSSMIIDGKILIDCGPHTVNALKIAGISLQSISDLLITHFHGDHFCAENIEKLALGRTTPLNIWYNSNAKIGQFSNCVLHPMNYFTQYNVSGYDVTGLPANHSEYPQHFSIKKDDNKLFYGLDGAWMLGETICFLKNKKYNSVILDSTVGDYCGDYRMGEHNSIPMIRLMVPSMKTLNIIDENTKIFLSHMAVTLHKNHSETCKIVKKDCFKVAFDGLSIEI